MEKLITTEELAKVLKITPRSVTRMLRIKKMGHKIGRRVFITEQEFSELVRNSKRH